MRKTHLALRALRQLDAAGTPMQAGELAAAVDSTRQFMPQVLAPMVRAGWITSIPGPRGGYTLATELTSRSLLDVIELIEGPTDDGRCVLGGTCQPDVRCAAHDAWSEARRSLLHRLQSTPITTPDNLRHDGGHER